MLRSLARSESSKVPPVSTTKRSASMEGPFGSTYSVNSSSATMLSTTARIATANCNYEAIDGRLGPLPPPPVPSINGRPSPPSSRSITQPLVNSQPNGTRRSPSLTNHPALGVSSLFSSSNNYAAIQNNNNFNTNTNHNNNNNNINNNNNVNQNRLSPGRITHLQLLTGGEHKKNEALTNAAFTSSSSSSASSSGSNPPSVPTTPESQSNERLSSLTRSQPDLSKLDELEYYLTNININNSNSNNYNLDGPSGNNINGNLNNNNNNNNHHHHHHHHSNSNTNNNNGNTNTNYHSVYVNTSSGAIGYTGCPIRFESQRCSGIDTDSLYSNAAVINQYSNSNSYSVNKLATSSTTTTNTANTSLPYGGRIMNSTCNLPPPSPPKSQVNKNSEYQNQAHIQELLRMENRALKSELEILKSKLAKYEKVEEEIQRVYQVHEEFVNSTDKKERLEKVLRHKLNMEVKKLQEENKQLKEQNETLASLASSSAAASASAAAASGANNSVNLVIDSTGNVSPCYSADSGTGNSSNSNRDKGRELLIARLLVTESKYLSSDLSN